MDMKLMTKTKSVGVVLVATIVAPGFTETGAPYKDASLPVEQRVEDLLGRMTLEEKVAQMRIFHANKGIKSGKNGELRRTDESKQHRTDSDRPRRTRDTRAGATARRRSAHGARSAGGDDAGSR